MAHSDTDESLPDLGEFIDFFNSMPSIVQIRQFSESDLGHIVHLSIYG